MLHNEKNIIISNNFISKIHNIKTKEASVFKIQYQNWLDNIDK